MVTAERTSIVLPAASTVGPATAIAPSAIGAMSPCSRPFRGAGPDTV